MPLDFSETMLAASYRGLSSLDVEVRTKQYGGNFRPGRRKKTWLQTVWGIVSEPMLLLLIGTTLVYFFIGTKLETAIFGFSIIPIVLIQYFQQRKTDRALEVLDSLLVEECQVYRDGVLKKLPFGDLVPGDLVHLTSGDKVPADGVVVRSNGFLIDESVLTGESVPVIKSVYKTELKNEHKLNQGTLVVQGEGQMVVLATGSETEYGKLGNLIENIAEEKTPLQKKVQDLVGRLAIAAIIIALFVGFVLGQSHGLMKGILGTLTISMSIIPEEFPVVFSVFLIMGVWRMSKRNSLVKKMVMVETLGSVTVICTDKTGTLTEGKMRIEKVFVNNQSFDVNTDLPHKLVQPLAESAVLAMERVAIDPMEIEMQRFAFEKNFISKGFFDKHIVKKDGSFDASTKTVNHIWQSKDGVAYQYTAGAPESVINACYFDFDNNRKLALKACEDFAKDGLRVVAVAKAEAVDSLEFKTQHLQFVGLIAMSDPPRFGVKESVEICKNAGVRVVMITGDYGLTAASIAEKIGLRMNGKVFEGKDLDLLQPGQLREVVKDNNIFARIRPEQKYLIVEALQANDEIVAMTGDGVNDAPALKKATVGIAMGKKGTAVARGAAGVILLDDNFTTIVKALEEGRRIYGNLRKAFVFLMSFHIPIVGLAIIPLLFGQDLYFLPIHIIFLELFCDPATVIGLENDPIDKNAMLAKPRPVHEPLINPDLWWQIGWQGAGILGLSLGFYGYGIWTGNLVLGRTLSFLSLVVGQLIIIMINRDIEQIKKNHVLSFLVILAATFLHLILLIPLLRELFHLTKISSANYIYTIILSLVVVVYFNLISRGKNGLRFTRGK